MATIYGQDENMRSRGMSYSSCTESLLYGLIGGNSICVGEELLVVNGGADSQLTLPPDTDNERATFAFIQVEQPVSSGVPADPDRLILYTELPGLSPMAGDGLYQGHFGAFEINGGVNLTNARFAGVVAATPINLRVRYYK